VPRGSAHNAEMKAQLDERVEELYKLSQQLPCWDSDIVTSHIMIIIIMVRRSPSVRHLSYLLADSAMLFIHFILVIYWGSLGTVIVDMTFSTLKHSNGYLK